jgi:hypothetical protein
VTIPIFNIYDRPLHDIHAQIREQMGIPE